MQSDITKLTLDNGLLVLLKEIHTAPLISHWIWYRVGSRNEVPGTTGASHWVEHMQFKGTATFGPGVLDKAIAREGGYWNAFTFMDWTTYFETMPANKIDLALRLEADRMTNSNFTLEDVDSERTVIISERQGNENEPLFLLSEAIQAAAFTEHSYGRQVIGDLSDLQRMSREQLYTHYRRYYVPNNAVLALAGDFQTDEMLERLRSLYEGIPPGEISSLGLSPEPAQYEGRQVMIDGPGDTTYVEAGFHAPAATDADFFPLLVADSLLCGASNLNLFGGGISNKTSRLYRALVESELATGIYSSLAATIDPFLYSITFIAHPQKDYQNALGRLEDEIKRLQDTPPGVEELQRAVKQARALFAYGSERITNHAFWLGFSEMFSDYDWYTSYLDKLAAVQPEEVQGAAQKYLAIHNRTLGVYLPDGEENETLGY